MFSYISNWNYRVGELLSPIEQMSNLNHGTPWLRSFLMTYSRENMVVVQVGAWDGSETAAIVSVVEKMNGKLIVMDWFKGNVSMDNQSDIFYTEDETQINYRIKRFWSYISKWCKENDRDEKVIRDIIDLRIGNSHDLIPELEDESIDFFSKLKGSDSKNFNMDFSREMMTKVPVKNDRTEPVKPKRRKFI